MPYQDDKKDNSHKRWAGTKKASMKRRSEQHDYTERGIYMVTLVVEHRQPLLGRLAGSAEATAGPDVPHVVLTPLGERVRNEWLGIPRYFPQVQVLKLCVMPDHIHGILFVHERMERHLGHVLNGFKAGTRRAARELGVITPAGPYATSAEAKPQPTGQAQEEETKVTEKEKKAAARGAEAVPYAEAPPRPKHPTRGTLWEPGYNDRVLLKQGQLQRWLDYLDDNPRRLLLKRQHPEFFTRLGTLTVAGTSMQAMGNAALLNAPLKLQVQCSRHLYPHEIAERQASFLQAGRQGAVIVSPCISPGEQQIATACMAAGVPLIVLLVKGLSPLFKPGPRYLQACAEGRLLLLSPYAWQNEKLTDMRRRCLHLNDLAALICQPADGI